MIQKIRITQLAFVAVCFISSLPSARAEDKDVMATPYRPTLSNPADLSEPGWLEMEFGSQRIKGGNDKSRDSYPVLAKLAFTADWGVMIGSELDVKRTDMDNVLYKGGGDTVLTIKHRIPTEIEGTAWGIEAGYKSPTANDTIGTGQADYILNGIFSKDISGHHLDLNLGVVRIGGVLNDIDIYQYNWAAAVSRNLNEIWGVFGELSGTYQRGMPSQSQLMAGVTYNYSKRIILDTGASSGLTAASQEWSVFAGATILLGKLW